MMVQGLGFKVWELGLDRKITGTKTQTLNPKPLTGTIVADIYRRPRSWGL